MLKLKKMLLLTSCVISLLSFSILANTNLSTQINTLINKMHRNAHIGVYVESLDNGKTIFARNSKALFTPASVQKVLTSAAALIYLKPTFRFQTDILMTGKIDDHQLNGNLYIRFGGDPSFNTKKLKHLITGLHKRGINTVNGDIIIDGTAYNIVPYPPGYLWDDLSYDFAAPLKTIIINDNKFGLSFSPAKIPGEKPTLSTALPLNTIHLQNNLRTIKKYQKHCPVTIYSDAHNHYTVDGCLLMQQGDQYRTLAIRNPELVFQSILKSQLKKNDIVINGKIKTGKTASDAHRIEVSYSKPLSKLVTHLLKTSDNLYTNTLVKKLGQTYYQQQGSWQNGLRAIDQILSKTVGINTDKIRINDGAGLSRYNLLSPRSIGKVLNYIYHHKALRQVFWRALPIAGVDGTLSGRMRMLAKGKKLRAKTGTMTGASSLAGFAFHKNHHYAFVIMANGYVCKKTPFARLENKIAELLMRA